MERADVSFERFELLNRMVENICEEQHQNAKQMNQRVQRFNDHVWDDHVRNVTCLVWSETLRD